MTTMTTPELARLVIEVLDLQREYFSLARSQHATPQARTDALEASKGAEKRLRQEAEAILDTQKRLF